MEIGGLTEPKMSDLLTTDEEVNFLIFLPIQGIGQSDANRLHVKGPVLEVM